jgi:hypothetical protein
MTWQKCISDFLGPRMFDSPSLKIAESWNFVVFGFSGLLATLGFRGRPKGRLNMWGCSGSEAPHQLRPPQRAWMNGEQTFGHVPQRCIAWPSTTNKRIPKTRQTWNCVVAVWWVWLQRTSGHLLGDFHEKCVKQMNCWTFCVLPKGLWKEFH